MAQSRRVLTETETLLVASSLLDVERIVISRRTRPLGKKTNDGVTSEWMPSLNTTALGHVELS